MSTKTLRKRIALVAVSAMGFGLLTSVSANAAVLSGTGSTGLVGDFASTDLTQTATLLNTGTLVVAKSSGKFITVSAGASITNASTISDVNASQNCVGGTSTSVTITPNGAIGSTFTIKVFASGGSCAAGITGALEQQATVTIAGASQSGTASTTNSAFNWVTADGNLDSAGVDDTDRDSTTRGNNLYLKLVLKDVYNAAITTAGALTAEVSSGAVVSVGTTVQSAGTFTTAVLGSALASGGVAYVTVAEKTAGTGWSGTVKISYNGTVISTRTGSISGDVSKITVTRTKVGTGSASTVGEYQAYDSAGNVVVLTAASLLEDTSSNPGTLTGTVGLTANTTTATGLIKTNCATSASGKSDVVMYYVNAAGAIIKSNSVTLWCGGAADTYKASFDKATYKQGDIATLTVSFLDTKGNPANSTSAVSASTADQVISAPQLTRVTDASAHAASKKVDASGQIVYTFTVGTDTGVTAGKYNAVVSFPTVNASNGANQSVPYEIVTTGSSVTNAEVLAAIVKLIASINKQITALQKLLTKKK